MSLKSKILEPDCNRQAAMVEIGSVIEASVQRIEPYGLFLGHGQEKVFVHLPEVSWRDTRALRERFRVGEVLQILVLRYNYPDRVVVGSIRRLHPEDNPYRELSRFVPGTVFQGKITYQLGGEVTVDLPNGAFGHMPKKCLPADLKIGQTAEVVISALEVEEGRLWLELPNPAKQEGNGVPTGGKSQQL